MENPEILKYNDIVLFSYDLETFSYKENVYNNMKKSDLYLIKIQNELIPQPILNHKIIRNNNGLFCSNIVEALSFETNYCYLSKEEKGPRNNIFYNTDKFLFINFKFTNHYFNQRLSLLSVIYDFKNNIKLYRYYCALFPTSNIEGFTYFNVETFKLEGEYNFDFYILGQKILTERLIFKKNNFYGKNFYKK